MNEAGFFLAGEAGEFRDKGTAGPVGEFFENELGFGKVGEREHTFASVFDFTERLWAAEKQDAENGGFAATEIQGFGDALLIFVDTAAAGDGESELLFAEAQESVGDGVVIVVDNGVAVGFLVAGVD